MAFCKTCGARFDWYRNAETGKFMPIEPDPVDDGNVRIDVVRNVAAVVPVGSHTPLYRSHFAACRGADKHRRKLVRHKAKPLMCDVPEDEQP